MTKLKAFGARDTGKHREQNEDNYFSSLDSAPELGQQYGHVFIVCDGVGGNRGGAVASDKACELIAKHFYAERQINLPLPQRLADSINITDHELKAISAENPELSEMSCTVVALAILGQQAAVAHMGDTRLYRLRNDFLEPLTKDHSWVQQQIDDKILSEAEAEKHPNRNIILRSLGGPEKHDVETAWVEIKEGDRFLICSDGLTGPVPYQNLHHYTRQNSRLEKIVHALIKNANDHGGPDNISAILVQAGKYAPPADLSKKSAKPSVLGIERQGGSAQLAQPAPVKARNNRPIIFAILGSLLLIGVVASFIFFSSRNNSESTQQSAGLSSDEGDALANAQDMPEGDESVGGSEQPELLPTSTIGSADPETEVTDSANSEQEPVIANQDVAVVDENTTGTEEETQPAENVGGQNTQVPQSSPTPNVPSREPVILLPGLLCNEDAHIFSANEKFEIKWTATDDGITEPAGETFFIIVQREGDIGGSEVRSVKVSESSTDGEWRITRSPSDLGVSDKGAYNWHVEHWSGEDREQSQRIQSSRQGCFSIGSRNSSGGSDEQESGIGVDDPGNAPPPEPEN